MTYKSAVLEMGEFPRLTTERLVLRPFDASDGISVERLAGAREVAEATLSIPHPYPAGGGAHWIATHATAWARREGLALAICDIALPSELLGAISLRIARAHSHGEIGYWIGLPNWGKGYATEAARAVTAFAFTELALHRVEGRHFTRNPASGRVLQKLGMRLEGVHRDAYVRSGRFEDVAAYAILATEWKPATPPAPR